MSKYSFSAESNQLGGFFIYRKGHQNRRKSLALMSFSDSMEG
ncbi:hypothetical protein CUZ96_1078 [Enterococcus lactis]|nr:hypothetical protein [Enterococcus lactis]